MHYRSYFLSELEWIERDDFRTTLSDNFGHPVIPLGTHGIYSKGNKANIPPTILINISRIPRKFENVISMLIVHLRKLKHTPVSSNNFMMYLLGRMTKFQGLIPTLLDMKSKLIQILNLLNNA